MQKRRPKCASSSRPPKCSPRTKRGLSSKDQPARTAGFFFGDIIFDKPGGNGAPCIRQGDQMKQVIRRGVAIVGDYTKARPKEVGWSIIGLAVGVVAGFLLGGVGIAAAAQPVFLRCLS